MIKGNGKFSYFWDLWIAISATFYAVEIPFRLVMHYSPSPMMVVLEFLIISSFIADIFIHFFTTVRVNGKWTDDKATIAKKYLKSWFVIDLIAAVPLGFFFLPAGSMAFMFSRLPKIIKVLRLFHYKSKWEYSINLNPGLINLGFFFYFLFLFIHWSACGWMEIKIAEYGTTLLKDYIVSFYYIITTVTTIGYGDLSPDKTRMVEVIYVMGIQLLGAGSYGYIIGNIATLIANIDIAKVHHRERVERVNTFMKSKKFPGELQERVNHYYDYLWTTREGYDDSAILEELPESFKYEFALLLNKGILEKVPMFKGADSTLLKEIVLCLKPCVYTPGDAICTFGEIGDKMFFINKGTVEVVSADGKQVYANLKDGDFFGEIALLLQQPRNATIRATDYCDLYSLNKESFDTVIHHYPDFEKNIKEMAQERMNKK